jgi:hypothetical protein
VLQVSANAGTAVGGMLVIEVTAPDIMTPLVFTFTLEDGVVAGSIEIPAGSARTLDLTVYDPNVVETHRGSVTLTVREGMNPGVSVTLLPLVGDVPINVTVGSIAISVSPALDTVAVGDTVRLSATVTDPDGVTMEVTVLWATLDPVIATVDTSGLVTARGIGSTQIVATYGGVGGVANVVVEEPPFTWTLITGLPGENLSAVWGSAADNVYNAGGYRSLNHYDGTTWNPVGYGEGANRYSVFGLGSTQVYSAGQGDVIAYDGTSWHEVVTASVELFDIWGSASDDLYAVGDGTVLRWDGTSWSSLPTGLSTVFNVDRLLSVWGTSATNLYTAGYAGRLMRWDGSMFTTISTGTTLPLHAIHGSSANDVWVVGAGGVIHRYDGSVWQSMPSGMSANLNGVYAITPSDVWIAGAGGLLLHWNGSEFDEVSSGTARDLGRVWAASANRIYTGVFGPGAILIGAR